MPDTFTPPTDPTFGAWCHTEGGGVHYVLRGKCLCGCGAKALAPCVERNVHNSILAVTPRMCLACKVANAARWAGMGR